MGLPPFDPEDPAGPKAMGDAVLWAAEDLRAALTHVRTSAKTYGIDPDRTVLGGFSSGGITA